MTIIDTSTVEVASARPRRRSSGTFGALGLLARRRLWRDRWLVVSSLLVVALVTLLAYAGPALVLRTIDDGAADAVNAAGPGADIVVEFPVGNPAGDNVSSVQGLAVEEFEGAAAAIPDRLPPRTSSVIAGSDAWILSTAIPVGWTATAADVADADEGEAPESTEKVNTFLTFGYASDAEVALVDGALPEPPGPLPTSDTPGLPAPEPEPMQVALSAAVAELMRVAVGDIIEVHTPVGASTRLEVSGIVAPAEPDAAVWDHFPEFAAGTFADQGAGPALTRGSVMLDQAGLAALTERLRTPFSATVRMSVDADAMTVPLARAVSREVRDLPAQADTLVDGVAVTVRTQLGAALDAYPARARAALAQMSIVIAGVVAVGAVVVALMARLLLSRRQGDVALERARGASVTSIGLRLLVESAIVTAVGVAVGFIAARLLTPGIEFGNGLVWVVTFVSLLASPLLGVALARRTWTGRREPANRQDRARLRKGRAARRATLEALALVIAAAAVVTMRSRGVLQTQTTGIDPFLAAAPVLVALAVVVIVVRLYPLPMAVIQWFARRTRGVAGVITLAKSRERIPVLPMLALTLSIAVAISGGLLVATVSEGQEQASWERVGGEVRIDAEVDAATADALRAQGLTVSVGLQKEATTVAFGSNYVEAFLLAMDESYPDVIADSGIVDPAQLRDLNERAAAWAPGEPVPALASQELIDVDVAERSEVYVGRTYVPVDIIGVPAVVPDGWASGPWIILPSGPLFATEFDTPVAPNLAFVNGPGAVEAVEATSSIPSSAVTTRDEWLDAVRDSALIGGVERAMTLAVAAVAALAAVALLVTVLQGVRERGRALSMLRTQGMGAGYGWWLAFAELGPLAAAAVIGGGAAGLLIMLLLASTLGLELLSGGIAAPALVADPRLLGYVAAGVAILLLLAVAAEVAAHRRNKLSEVLRWGESR